MLIITQVIYLPTHDLKVYLIIFCIENKLFISLIEIIIQIYHFIIIKKIKYKNKKSDNEL